MCSQYLLLLFCVIFGSIARPEFIAVGDLCFGFADKCGVRYQGNLFFAVSMTTTPLPFLSSGFTCSKFDLDSQTYDCSGPIFITTRVCLSAVSFQDFQVGFSGRAAAAYFHAGRVTNGLPWKCSDTTCDPTSTYYNLQDSRDYNSSFVWEANSSTVIAYGIIERESGNPGGPLVSFQRKSGLCIQIGPTISERKHIFDKYEKL